MSICVQTFQHSDYIGQCLEGILEQKTDFVFEILLGEDSSTDGTREICKDYAERYPDKIRLFLHHRRNNIRINGSPTGRFNFLYNCYTARGKYIAFCEGDDFWADPLKLQKQINFLERNEEFVLTFHDAKLLSGTEILEESYVNSSLKGVLDERRLKEGPYILPMTLCYRNVINDFPEEFFKVLNGDVFLISLLGNHGKGFFHKEITHSFYRQHPTSMWSSRNSLNRLVNQLTTYHFLRKYYRRKKEESIANYFSKKFSTRSFIFLETFYSLEDELQIISRYFRDNLYETSLWYGIYKLAMKATGKGYIFKKKFLQSLKEI